MTVEQIADFFRTTFGKLSWLDHTLFDALKKTQTIEGLNKFIVSLPATLSASEIEGIEKIVFILLEADNEYEEYVIS